MAARRFYAYYIRGRKLALVEYDNVSGAGQTLGQPTLDDIGPSGSLAWKSPVATVADGLEIEYAYSPRYFIESTDVSTTTVSGWDQDNNGSFRLRASGSTNWTSSPDLSGVGYIVLRNAGRFNGLHKVESVTNNRLVTATKVAASTSETLFEETVTLYYDVNVLDKEYDTIDLPEYLSKALVYYVKAKVAEDRAEIEEKEYFMREFRRILEKHESSKIWGSRQVIPGAHGIR
jgi:hypothetical protein